uniref:Vitamin B12-binding protein n=1 Tax=Candidatus Methanogaster sp. ANME-2c ERB4 TaxID=2759911 RepID=A0A7G9YMX0_9EURY|nr:vitamin B12-binding protein [Methanosarcinales archaeon ANME-2c ERB4]
MKPISCALMVLWLVMALSMIPAPVCASVTGDTNGDDIVSKAELTGYILDYLDGSSEISLSDLRSGSHIHAYYPRTIVDSNEDELTLYKPIKRIIAYNSNCAEVIRSLGATKDVIGIGTAIEEDDFFSEFGEVPAVGKWNSPDCEKILALDPDAVIVYGKWPEKGKLDDKLKGTGIEVIRLDLFIPENMTSDVQKLGIVLERESEAGELIDFYQHYTDLIVGRVGTISEEERQTIYLEGYTDLQTVSGGSGGGQMCVMAGGINIASDLVGAYPKVDPEWVIAQNPDIMIKASSSSYDNTSEPDTALNDIVIRPGWADMDAVRNDRVHLLTTDIYVRPRYIIGVAYMAQWLYPDLFADIDPADIHQEYLERFQGMEVPDKIFVYPASEP